MKYSQAVSEGRRQDVCYLLIMVICMYSAQWQSTSIVLGEKNMTF